MAKGIRKAITEAYALYMAIRQLVDPPKGLEDALLNLINDTLIFAALESTRYIMGRAHRVPKLGNMHLAWQYLESPQDEHRFLNMFRIPSRSFHILLTLIEDHPVFHNSSHIPQAPVEVQLGVCLYRMGRYGNGASTLDVARTAGISEGSVVNYTRRCLEAIESLHTIFIRKLSPEEKESQKQWIDRAVRFRGTWREGWVMYDGTIVVLAQRPGQHGDSYYTRKGNYGLNLQIGNVPSNLRIVDYSHGMTGAAHDAAAFAYTAAAKHPDWFYDGPREFAFFDSAYACTGRCIPVHKEPASREPTNAIFNKYVSHIRVRSEHCMGAFKGRWESLRGLRIFIDSNEAHFFACRWITCCLILHNLVIDTEGTSSAKHFYELHRLNQIEEQLHDEFPEGHPQDVDEEVQGQAKRQLLIDELMAYRAARDAV